MPQMLGLLSVVGPIKKEAALVVPVSSTISMNACHIMHTACKTRPLLLFDPQFKVSTDLSLTNENHNNILPSILSSVISSGSGSSTSPLSSLKATGGAAAISALKIYLQPHGVQKDAGKNHRDAVNLPPTITSFVQQVQANRDYRYMIYSNSEYEVRLVHGTKQLHWFLMVKMFRSKLPYFTLEITTTADLCDLIPTMRSIAIGESDESSATPENIDSHSETCIADVGSYKGTLHDLCQVADKVVEEMKSYNLVTSNRQHFCNNLLRKLKKKTFRMTVGRLEKEKNFDYYSNVISSDVPTLVCADTRNPDFLLH